MKMTHSELAEVILKTLSVFEFLQFVDENYERANPAARSIVEGFFERCYGKTASDMTGVVPFAQLKTTLPILLVALCFASRIREEEWAEAGFKLRNEYAIEFAGSEDPTPGGNWNVGEVIATMRNACAHLPDLVDLSYVAEISNVSFQDCCVRFASVDRKGRRRSSVTFTSQDGFVEFLRDYLRAIRKLVREKLLEPGPDQRMPYLVN